MPRIRSRILLYGCLKSSCLSAFYIEHPAFILPQTRGFRLSPSGKINSGFRQNGFAVFCERLSIRRSPAATMLMCSKLKKKGD
jgi:hypothetical protein